MAVNCVYHCWYPIEDAAVAAKVGRRLESYQQVVSANQIFVSR